MFGEASIELAELMEDVALIKKPLGINNIYYDEVLKDKYKDVKLEFDKDNKSKFYITLHAKDKKGKVIKRGKINMTIDIMPQDYADKNAVAKARDTPNHSPMLPAPQGRLELSFNPFKMLAQLVGPALRRKIYLGLCCAACLALCVMVLPNIVGGIFLKILGLG
jgi:hypothetical protein